MINKNLWLMIFGITVPIAAFILMFINPIITAVYFGVSTAAITIYTLMLDKKQNGNTGKLFMKFAGVGAIISVVFTVLARYLPYGLTFILFPPSILWMAFTPSSPRSMVAIMHLITLLANATIYLLYGCIYYHYKKLPSHQEPEPNA